MSESVARAHNVHSPETGAYLRVDAAVLLMRQEQESPRPKYFSSSEFLLACLSD